MSELKLQIAFTRPSHWLPLSWLIMAIEKRNFSHCIIILQHPFFMNISGPMILEASITGITWSHDKTRSVYKLVEAFDLKFSEAEIEDFLKRASPLIGKRYGYIALLGMAWQKFVKWTTGKAVRNPLANTDTFVCSEFIGTLLTTHPLFDDIMAGRDLESFGTSELQKVLEQASNTYPKKIVKMV